MFILVNLVQVLLIFVVTAFCASGVIIGKYLFGVRNYPYLVKKVWAPCILKVSGVKIKVNGLENLIEDEPCIYVANHQSHYDIPALICALSPTLFFIAKKELKNVPFLGWAMSAAGLIFIDRSNKQKSIESLEEASSLIKSGKNILSFPEGTRAKNGEIRLFKRGTFIMAKQAKVKIIPISIFGSHKVHQANSLKIKSGTIHVTIGKPIAFETYKDLNPDAIAEKVQKEIIILLK
jgi:1-acyl-sn-glycerol-3-phosphate acyltransferase